LQIGDHYWSYQYTPWGLGLASVSNWLDARKYEDFKEKDSLDMLAYSLQSVSSTITNQSFLSGLSVAFDMISGKSPAEQISAGKRFVSSTTAATAVPFSSGLKDIESIFTNPTVPKINNMRQAMVASIPFASQALKPQLNALGEPVMSARNRIWSHKNDDPVWKLVAEKDLRVPVPNVFFDTPDDQYEYVQSQGQKLRKWMEANLTRLRGMDQKNAQHMLETAADNFRQQARNRLLNQGAQKRKKK
jgi:hypothetical protein